MAFVDEIKVHIRAGSGGDGVVRWRQEKGKDKAGAAGGDGGRGGDVYIRGSRNFHVLSGYRHVKEFSAQNGDSGAKHSADGRDGDDLIIDLPIGSIVTNLDTEKTYNLLDEKTEIKILSGGRGGYGNEHFKASTNVRPYQSTEGKPGEEADFLIELSLVADAGLIGLPNAGKSSLLNSLTSATSKVGSYAFTTKEPHLGALYGFVLADIPGLIQGASTGKGLGHKFLRHITRTNLLLHCVSIENEDLLKTYNEVREELGNYDKTLLDKPEVIILTKSDLASEEQIETALKTLKQVGKEVVVVSVNDTNLIKKLSENITNHMSKARNTVLQ